MAKGIKGFQQGKSGNPGGRKSGTQNRTTKEAKKILNNILFGEIDNIKLALAEIRKENNYRYIDCLSKLLPFVIAKKTDVTSDDEPIKQNLNITVDHSATAETLKKLRDGTKTD